MTYDELVQRYREQFTSAIDEYVALDQADVGCAFAAGMLQLVSSMYLKHSDIKAVSIQALRQAILDIGEARGWGVGKIGDHS